MCVSLFKSGDMEGQRRICDIDVGKELCGVACCMGSGIVTLKYSAIQRLMGEIKQRENMPFSF